MTADHIKAEPSTTSIESTKSTKNKSSKQHKKPLIELEVGSRPNAGSDNDITMDNEISVSKRLDSPQSRRQRVIGGDLTGVSSGRKRGFFSRFSLVSYANLLAVGIVLAILAVFFWPNTRANSVQEISKAQETQIAGYRGVERTDEVVKPSSIAFSRDSDLERANAFRKEDEQEKQIRSLLSAAQIQFNAGQYSAPVGNNAADKYRQILDIAPNNRKAKEGLTLIRDKFLENGTQALEKNNIALARSFLDQIKELDAESSQSIELDNAISHHLNTAQANKYFDLAKAAYDQGRLILPAQDNALYYYQKVQELFPQNVTAYEGIKSIADNFAEKANIAILDGDLALANGYLATVSVIDAQHPSISLLEAMISNANANPVASDNGQTVGTQDNETQAVGSETTTTTLPRKPSQVSQNKTPEKVAQERAEFDRRYLQKGLNAYYQGKYDEAAALLQPLADRGVSRAQFRIGYMHYLGRGFEEDAQKADQIIRAALPAVQRFAEEGRGWAQSDIGSLYEDGLVLPRNYAEAVYWYRSAAEQGYPGAQTNLGVMYARGLGVTASRNTAIEWFQKAAAQGDVAAQRNLTAMGINSESE